MAEGRRGKDGIYLHSELTDSILAAAIEVQRALGPGLLESAYEACLSHRLRQMGHTVLTQVGLDIRYEGLVVPNAFRMNLVVDDRVVVELKTAERLLDIHQAQLASYLRFSGHQVGLLLNFWSWPLKDGGIKRIANSNSA